jgi:hypothetical protein
MSGLRTVRVAVFLLLGWLCSAAVAQDPALTEKNEIVAQRRADLALTRDSEVAFERFIHMAQTGQLGEDVSNANVGILKNHVRVELVRPGAPVKVLLLTPKGSNQAVCRYFDIAAGDGATAGDVARVGQALDAVFGADPFQLAYDVFNASPGGDPLPSLAEAWAYGGWRGVLHGFERRTVALAGLPYTIVVIVALAAAFLTSLWLLWGSTPPRAAREFLTDDRGDHAGGAEHPRGVRQDA